MRPLYLSIQGFGPYLKTVLDENIFYLIHKERLFLISGEIGSGKTTLFDAILFAIFGEASFPERTPKDLISHLLKRYPQIVPEVTFNFLYQGKIYRVLRRPPYERQTGTVSLWIGNKLYSQKAGEVSEKIRELFGLDGKQFKKVFLIPQGEYREILLSDPKERKALFEKLFDTETLSRLEEFFKEQAKALKEKLTLLQEREAELMKLAEVSRPEELVEKLKYLSNQKELIQRELKKLTQGLKHCEEDIKKKEQALELLQKGLSLEKELKELSTKLPEIEALKEKVEKLKSLRGKAPYLEALERNKILIKERHLALQKEKTSIEKLNIALKENSQRLNELSEREAHIKIKREELLKKEEALQTLQKARLYEENLRELERRYLNTKNELESVESSGEVLQKKLELIQKEREELKNLLEISRALAEKKEKLSYLRAFYEKNQNLLKLKEKLKELERQRHYLQKELEHLKMKHLAIILSQNLREGEPCPVCGSLVHPAKPQRDLFLPQIEHLQKNLEKVEAEIENTKKEASHLEGELSFLQNMVQEKEEEIKESLLALEKSYGELVQKKFSFKELTQYEKKEKELKLLLEGLERQKKELQNRLLQVSEKRASLEGEIKALKGFLKDSRDEEKLKEEIKRITEEIKLFEENSKKLQATHLKLERALHTHMANYENLKREIKERLQELKAFAKELVSLIKGRLFKNFSEIKKGLQEIKNLPHYEKYLFDFERDRHRLTLALRELKEEASKNNLTLNPETLKQLTIELTKLNQEKLKIEKEKVERERNLGKVEELLHQSENYLKSYGEILKEKRVLEEEYPYLEKLSLLLSGKNTNISFHSFVLSRFLSLILKKANTYFSDFTFGRYRFVEGDIFTKRFILEVFDTYTGSKREVKTLSGGESFLAALSFALGSSDVLLTLSKKGPLETLLIDEGFGSLDEQTLDRVVQSLLNLSQRTGKIIGVISHLKELKERFPLVLEVIKNPEGGSSIKMRRNL
jgi:exonuclease SbcC